jgi:tellurite resistance protein
MEKMKPQSSIDQMTLEWVQSISNDGKLDASELEKIVDIAMQDGVMDEDEKSVLINIIANLDSNDFDLLLWEKVERLIKKFKLDTPR